jgi:hypothetical protein
VAQIKEATLNRLEAQVQKHRTSNPYQACFISAVEQKIEAERER